MLSMVFHGYFGGKYEQLRPSRVISGLGARTQNSNESLKRWIEILARKHLHLGKGRSILKVIEVVGITFRDEKRIGRSESGVSSAVKRAGIQQRERERGENVVNREEQEYYGPGIAD